MDENKSNSGVFKKEKELKFIENIMIQKLDKKKNVNLSKEIAKRKKIFFRYMNEQFGKNFFKIKPESYLDLVDRCRTFYFSPDSQFLNNFPKLKKRILQEKKINNDKLLAKIDAGSLLYLSEAPRKKRNSNIRKTERLLTFSRNFALQNTKDLVSNEIIKLKFWKNNSKKNRKILKKRYARHCVKNSDHAENDNNEIENNEDDEMNKENNRYNPINSYYNNIPMIYNDGGLMDNYENINANENLKENYNYNSLKDSSFPSLINNTTPLKTFSNSKSINPISRNIKIIDLKKCINKTSLSSSLQTGLKNNLSVSQTLKYKKNINNKVELLNSQTKKCNFRLYNLINNNHSLPPENKLKNSELQFDINYALSESSNNNSKWKKNNKGTFSYLTYEKLNAAFENSLKGENINLLVKEAKDNMSSEGKIKKRELKHFPKRIFEVKEEYALKLVDKLFSRNKLMRIHMPEIKETLKEKREMKEHKYINELRDKAKFNHKKIIRMAFYLSKEKDRFNNKYHDTKRNKNYDKENKEEIKAKTNIDENNNIYIN